MTLITIYTPSVHCLQIIMGIIMSNDGAFSGHVEFVSGKVKQKSSWILRIFQSRNTWFMKYIWKTIVQCHIDYCSQLYLPGNPADLERLENLQRFYTKKIPEVSQMDYWSRLQHLKMYSQQRKVQNHIYLESSGRNGPQLWNQVQHQ